jgi:glyoxylase-like metal-dependent hydrolase (beta-lactamase superfamily II)
MSLTPPAEPVWSDAGAVPVAAGVHRIPLPLPTDALKAVNVYAIEDADGLVLIDAGWAIEAARTGLEVGLNSIGYELGDVRRFLVTHVHRDHYTLGIVLRKEFGMKVALGLGEQHTLDLLLTGKIMHPNNHFDHLRRSGAEPLIEALSKLTPQAAAEEGWDYPDEWLRDAQRIELAGRTLDVVATPGHTRGHVVFVDRANQLLFAGDHVLPHITPSIGLEATAGSGLPLADYMASLRLMNGLPDLTLLPAHGQVGMSVHTRVGELLSHHERRLDQSEAAVRSGARTAYETARILTWTRRENPFDSLDLFNQLMATMETQAHLDVLALRGRLISKDVDGIDTFEPAPQ